MEATATRIQVSRMFAAASPEEVFAACTDPDALSSWFAPNYEMYPDMDLVPVVGGTYRVAMRHQGGNVHTAYGTYVEVVPPRRLAFTWNWEDEGMAEMGESFVTIDIEAAGEGARLTLTHDGFPNEAVAGEHQQGWTGCLARLSELFAPSVVRHLATTLALHRRLYLNALAGIADEDLRKRLSKETNHMLWIAGHLAHTRGMIAQALGQPLESPLAVFNEAISDDHDYPGWDEVEAYYTAASAAIQRGLLAVTPEGLMAPHGFPYPIPLNDQTLGGLLDFLVDHESYHLGQLGFLRKRHGYGAMSYAATVEQRAPHHGRFTWYDLVTSDVEGAIRFYGAVTGWAVEEWTGGDGAAKPYTMWTNGGKPLGGVVQLPGDVPEGTPPHWIPYIGTADVDATVGQAEDLGGLELRPPQDMPNVGRIAILADPLGAPFAIFQPLENAPGHDAPPEVGEFSWHDLVTTDYLKAFGFYNALFGWQGAGAHDMADIGMGIYKMFGRKGVPLGGIFDKSAEMPGPSAWLLYIKVEDLKKAVAAVTAHGGQQVGDPVGVPGGDVIVQCVDPQGARFALHAGG